MPSLRIIYTLLAPEEVTAAAIISLLPSLSRSATLAGHVKHSPSVTEIGKPGKSVPSFLKT